MKPGRHARRRPDNIITHPSAPRYKSLAEAMAALRLAEREGIGIDRMVGDMLAVGLREPGIAELAGPSVRVSLIGGDPDREIVGFLGQLEPRHSAADLDIVLLIDHLTRHGFVDVAIAERVLQRPADETIAAIDRASHTTIGDKPMITRVAGVPGGHRRAYRLSDAVKQAAAPATCTARIAFRTGPDDP